ncbi:MAG: LuxR C-terminal-related transcriptional regulator [Methylosarcina sp.]
MATSFNDDEDGFRQREFSQVSRAISPGIVMIISDSSPLTSVLAEQLSESGFGIISVPPYSNIKCFGAGCPDLILIDCKGKCIDIVKNLRISNPIPIISLTDIPCNELPDIVEPFYLSEFRRTSDQIEPLIANIRNKLDQNQWAVSKNPKPCFIEYCGNQSLHSPAACTLNPSTATCDLNTDEKQVTALVNEELHAKISTADKAISVLVVSEREKIAESLTRQITQCASIGPIDIRTASPERLSFQLEQFQPDVLLLDTSVSPTTLSERLKMIREKLAAVKIVLLYDGFLPDCMDEIVEFGVSGCLSIEAQPQMVIKGIWAVYEGELWLPRYVLAHVFKEMLSKQVNAIASTDSSLVGTAEQVALLTPQEKRVAELVALGLTNKEIARQCAISPETIKKHLQKIFEKLGINRRSQLAILQANEVLLQRKDQASGKFKAA